MEVHQLVVIFALAFLGVVSEENNGEKTEWPKGHLQPLGSHRPPDEVEERTDFPAPREFWENYVKISKPVVFRGAAMDSTAMTQWTEEFLRSTYGDLTVRLEGKKEKQSDIPVGARGIGRDTIANFMSQIHNDRNAYTVSELPTPMWKDVTVIPPMTCGIFAKRLVEVDLWMSGGGTSSILHKDAFNAINCLLNGTKEWKLIEFKHQDKIYKVWEPDREIGGFSALNVEAVNLLQYPNVKEVPWAFTTVHAGDCLFLPKSMWHQVKSYGSMNVAVALLFSRFEEEYDMDFSDCGPDLLPVPLSKFELDWQYSGYGEMSMGNPDLYSIRYILKDLLQKDDNNVLTSKMLISWLKEMYDERDEGWIHDKAAEILTATESFNNGPLSLEDLENCDRSCLRAFALAVEPTTIENTENFEYNYINPEDVGSLIEHLIEKHGQLEKTTLAEHYQKFLKGTETFALKLFVALGGEDRESLPAEEVKMNLEKALQPYFDFQTPEAERPEDAEDLPSPYEARPPVEFETGTQEQEKDEL